MCVRELALFAGAGGGLLASRILGWNTVCAVEIDDYCRRVLLARQRDGMLDRFPIWDDVRTFDGTPWRGRVDVISEGFPCQDIASSGSLRGLAGSRSGLWHEYARIIREVAPKQVLVENSPHLRTRGLVRVLQDLARMGYDARWCVLGANAVGAPQLRKRMWVVANTNDSRQRESTAPAEVARTPSHVEVASKSGVESPPTWWPVAVLPRVDDGLAHRMDRVRATGNGQVPRVAAMAWRLLQ